MTNEIDRIILKSLPWRIKYKDDGYPSFSEKFAFIGKRHIHGSDEIFIIRKYYPEPPGNGTVLIYSEPLMSCQSSYEYIKDNSLTYTETIQLIDYINSTNDSFCNIGTIVIEQQLNKC